MNPYYPDRCEFYIQCHISKYKCKIKNVDSYSISIIASLVNITAVIYNAKNIRLEILQIVMMRKFNIRSESSRKQRDTP